MVKAPIEDFLVTVLLVTYENTNGNENRQHYC